MAEDLVARPAAPIGDSRRQANDPARGFIYQIWYSTERWLALTDEEVMYLEAAEDVDVVVGSLVRTTQVKDTAGSGSVTLRSDGVIEAIENLLDNQRRDPHRAVSLRFLTTAERGHEKPSDFGEWKGLDYWDRCREPGIDITPLRTFITSQTREVGSGKRKRRVNRLGEKALAYLREAPDDELRERVIRRIEWVTGAGRIPDVEREIQRRLIAHGTPLGLLPSDCIRVADRLLREVSRKICKKRKRRLYKADFLEIFEEEMTDRVPRQEHAKLRRIAADAVDAMREAAELRARASDLEVEVAAVKDRELSAELDRLEDLTRRGYADAAKAPVFALLEREEREPLGGRSVAPRARLLTLAAEVSLVAGGQDGATRARELLTTAYGLNSGDEDARRRLVAARLALAEAGPEAALRVLEGDFTPEAERLRFALLLDLDRLKECTAVLDRRPRGETTARAWQRLIASYHAGRDNEAAVDEAVSALTEGTPEALDVAAAARALMRHAFIPLADFCERFGLSPRVSVALKVDDLVRPGRLRRAAELFRQAASLYERAHCREDAAAHFAQAASMFDTLERDACLVDLRRVDPDHPAADEAGDSAEAVERALRDLDRLTPVGRRESVLARARALSARPGGAPSLIRPLLERAALFAAPDLLELEYLYTILGHFGAARERREAEQWVAGLRLPRTRAYVRPLFLAVIKEDGDGAVAARTLENALRATPGNPELLALAVRVFSRRAMSTRALECARELFEIVRSAQTAEYLLGSLIGAHRYQEFLDRAEEIAPIGVPPARLHAWYAMALVACDRLLETREHLEALRADGAADADHLLLLSRVLAQAGEGAGAVAMLHEAVERFPDEPRVYFALAQAHLRDGSRGLAFQCALRARARLRDDPRVAAFLLTIAFPAGYEDDEEVRLAFAELVPGGRFAGSGLLTSVPVEEGLAHIRAHAERAADLARMYAAGEVPLLLRCYRQSIPAFQAHVQLIADGRERLVGPGPIDMVATQLPPESVDEAVLDYTALLTLWSLYGGRLVGVLRHVFRRVHVPERVLHLLHSDLQAISELGQPARDRAVERLLAARARDEAAFVLHDADDAGDVLGEAVEGGAAGRLGLAYVNEYAQAATREGGPVAGLRVLADAMRGADAIDPDLYDTLTATARRVDEPAGPVPTAGGGIVVSAPTLITVAMAGALNAVIEFAGVLHVSRVGWERLDEQARAAAVRVEMTEDLRTLIEILGAARSEGFLQVTQPGVWDDGAEPDEPDEGAGGVVVVDDPARTYLASVADAIGTAAELGLPLWADDLRVREYEHEGLRPAHTFGTDFFLGLLDRTRGTHDRHTRVGRLFEWGYRGLPLTTEYVEWALSRGVGPSNPALVRALEAARRYLEMCRVAVEAGGVLAARRLIPALMAHTRLTADILKLCFERHVGAADGAEIFRALDPTRAAMPVGREPVFYLSLIWGITTAGAEAPGRLAAFRVWLDRVMRGGGATAIELQEAWYQVIARILRIASESEEAERAEVAFFGGRLMMAAPAYAQDYVNASDIGARVRAECGVELHENFPDADAPGGQRSVRAEEVERDLFAAVEAFLESEPAHPISHGEMTVRAAWYSPGSLVLRCEGWPRETRECASGNREWSISLLAAAVSPVRAHREIVVRQCLRKIEALGLEAAPWEALSVDAHESEEGGRRLLEAMLSDRAVFRSMASDAALAGPERVVDMLSYLTPDAVRALVGRPQADGLAPDRFLTRTTEDIAAAASPDVLVRAWLDGPVRSLFADGRAWCNAVAAACAGCPPTEAARLEKLILEAGERDESLVVKANVALAILASEAQPGPRPVRVGARARALVREVCGAAVTETLRQDLGELLGWHLWLAWTVGEGPAAAQAAEYFYLCGHGGQVVADLFRRTGTWTRELEQAVRAHLQALFVGHEGGAPEASYAGVVRPNWGSELNIALAYVVKGLAGYPETTRELLLDPECRTALVRAAAGHRFVAAHLYGPGLLATRFDESVSRDPAARVAEMLGPFLADGTITEEERGSEAMLACLTPDRGFAERSERLRRLPTAEEAEATTTVRFGLHAHPFFGEGAAEAVAELLSPRARAAAERFAGTYGALVDLAATAAAAGLGLSTELTDAALSLLFSLPASGTMRSELIERHAVVLARLLEYGLWPNRVIDWLGALARDENVPVTVARRSLRPFIALLPRYAAEHRLALGELGRALAAERRLDRLWELERLVRDAFPREDRDG